MLRPVVLQAEWSSAYDESVTICQAPAPQTLRSLPSLQSMSSANTCYRLEISSAKETE
jgi:hypothetical protein